MKVLNLRCAHQHDFEGWFASEEDYQSQLARALVECPLCGDKSIAKMPSAPRLNLGGGQEPVAANPAKSALAPAAGSGDLQALHAAWAQMARHVLAHTENVGERFAEEARRMHYGESEERAIRGQASREEAVALMEEGIEVLPLPLPAALKETLQ
jgi:hypothetical protein